MCPNYDAMDELFGDRQNVNPVSVFSMQDVESSDGSSGDDAGGAEVQMMICRRMNCKRRRGRGKAVHQWNHQVQCPLRM